jgi:hypothetical protein
MSKDSTSERLLSGGSPSKSKIDFEVYANEPLMRFLVQVCRANPITLGIGFYAVVTFPLCVWQVFIQPPGDAGPHYVSFLDNISWSISMIFLFPFVVGLTLEYYRKIPRLFEYLIEEILEERNENEIRDFLDKLRRRFAEPWSPVLFAVLTLFLNGIYFRQVLNDPQRDWINSGLLFQEWLHTTHGLTWHGLYAAIVQVVLIYWVLNLVWKGFVLACGLHEFFNKRRFQTKVELLHPDGVCGFRPIGSMATTLNVILFLLGIYLSLKVIDKIIVQQSSLFEDIGNPMMLGGYAILAPLLFFLPLGAAHDKMLEAKDGFLRPICARCEELLRRLGAVELDQNGSKYIESLSHLEKLRDDLKRKIPVWPFDFKSLQAFFGTIVVPLLPVILPVLIQLLFGPKGGNGR